MTDGDELAWLRRRVADLEAEAEIAARLASYDDGGPGVERKYRFIAAEAANFAVTTLCRVTRVSRSAYYAWAAKADGPSLAVAKQRTSPTWSGMCSGPTGAATARRG